MWPHKLVLRLLPFAVVLLLVASGRVSGQAVRSFAYYDSLTYQQYLHEDWKTLAESGNEALSKGYDYYYLRARLGIAFFNLKDYRKAAYHFEKALNFNNTDPVILQYQYGSLIEAGRGDEAVKLARENQMAISTVPGYSRHFFRSGNLESGFTSGKTSKPDPQELMGADGIYGEEDYINEQQYYQGGLQMQLSGSLSLYLGISNLKNKWQKHLAYNLPEIHRDSIVNTQYSSDYYYSFPKVQSISRRDYSDGYTGFYVMASWLPASGLKIVPAFHFLGGTSGLDSVKLVEYTATDTAYFLYSDSSWHTFDYPAAKYQITNHSAPYNHYLASITIIKEIQNWTLAINGSYGKLASSGSQLQAGASVTYFPFGNLSLYSTLSLTGFKNKNDSRIIGNGIIGKQLGEKLWTEAEVTIGDLSLTQEKNGFIVYNIQQPIRYRLGVNLFWLVHPQLEVQLMGRYYARENNYYSAVKNSETGAITWSTGVDPFNNYSFFGGIKWKF